jgi:hypothetical protein
MPKVLTIAGASILALGLILGLTLPSLAAPEVAPPWFEECEIRIVKGEVLSVGDGEFDIQSGEKELTIRVDSETKYYKLCVPGRIISLTRHWMQFRHQNWEEIGAFGWGGMGLGLQNQVRNIALAWHQMRLQNQVFPLDNGDMPEPQWAKVKWLCPFGEESAFSDIEEGDRVVVWLADGDNLAERVLIIKPTTYASVSGTITDVSLSAIEITPDDGAPVTLSYNESTVFILKGVIEVEQWQYARAIYAVYDSDNGNVNGLAKRVVMQAQAQ